MIGDDETRNPRRQVGLNLARGTLVKADDKPMLQEVRVRGMFGEVYDKVEHLLPYGMTAVPLPPKDNKEAEVFMAFLGSDRSHPVVIGTVDRRHRPKDMKEGEVALHDDQNQSVHIGRDAITITAKSKIVISAGGEGKIVIEGNKVTIFGSEINLGGEGGKLVHRKGDVDSDGDIAAGSATKVYAV